MSFYRLLFITIALICFCRATAITIVNKNPQPISYSVWTEGLSEKCVDGNLNPHHNVIWITSDTSPNCKNPQHIEVHVSGATSTKGAYCSQRGDTNPRLVNVGTIVEVVDAGPGQGVHCWVTN